MKRRVVVTGLGAVTPIGNTEYREKAYRFMRKQVLEGRQCYVICPMVEESESLDAENVSALLCFHLCGLTVHLPKAVPEHFQIRVFQPYPQIALP